METSISNIIRVLDSKASLTVLPNNSGLLIFKKTTTGQNTCVDLVCR